jgi:molecular chaperone GrpE (heat shock protein)
MLTFSKNPPLWPFLVADAFFLAVGSFLFWQASRPLHWWEAGCLIVCAALGAGAFVTPFLIRAANSKTLLQAQTLANMVEKIQKLDQLAVQISYSTGQWQTIQDASAKTVQTAKELSQAMTTELTGFTEFVQKANDAERNHLRLEAEKLRRAETEWLQVVVRLLDQVHALFQAAANSGQTELIGQIGQFQNACREIARRVGLTPWTAQSGEAFDPKRHQLVKDGTVPENAVIIDTLAPGYTFQGQPVRRILVRLQEHPVPPSS